MVSCSLAKCRVTLKILKWAVLCLLLGYMTLGHGWRDIIIGRWYRFASEMFSPDGEVTEVQIYLLAGEESQKINETFWVARMTEQSPVFGKTEIREESELKVFMRIWRQQELCFGHGGMCHDPAYGFRLFQNGKLLRETSLCWACHNFAVGVFGIFAGNQGFVAEGKAAQQLLEFCDKRLPYKRHKPKDSAASQR